jgi:hypothetical protein
MKQSILQIIGLILFSFILKPTELFAFDEIENNSKKRNFWFYGQRMIPLDTIFEDLMQNAIEERIFIRAAGYYLNPTTYSWLSMGGVTGRINTVKFADNNTLIIGAANGGVWKSNNFRQPSYSWSFMDVNSMLTSNTTGAIAVDKSSNPPTIYYGTGEGIYGFIYAYLGDGIFKTTNWGENWTRIGNGLEKELQVFRITVRPGSGNSGQIFAVTNKGLFRSTNSGNNWSVVDGTSGFHCNDIIFSNLDDDLAYAVGPKPDHELIPGIGFMKSENGGASFTFLDDTGFEPIGRSHLDIYEDENESCLYAITANGEAICVYKSSNNGESFTGPVYCNTPSQLGYNMFIKTVPENPEKTYVGGIGLFKKAEEEVGYAEVVSTMHSDFHNMDINPDNPDEIAVVNDGGIYLSTDAGNTWNARNSGLPLMSTYRIYTNEMNQIFGGMQDAGFVQNNGNGFISTIFGGLDGTSIFCSKYDPQIVIGITGADGWIRRSTDGGITQNDVVALTGKWDGGNDWTGVLTEHPQYEGYFYSARRSNPIDVINIWRSTNFGANWDLHGSVSAIHAPQNLVFSSDPEIVYMSSSGFIGSTWQQQYFGRGLFKSTNGGITWQILIDEEDSETIPFHYITRIATHQSSTLGYPDEVYITLSGHHQSTNSGHLFKSTNGGSNWTSINGNLPNTPVNDIITWHPSNCGVTDMNMTVATMSVFLTPLMEVILGTN